MTEPLTWGEHDPPRMRKGERLEIILHRLQKEPAYSTAEEARAALERAVNEVEDELTSVPFDPRMWRTDGRIYAPQDDQARTVKGFPDITRFSSLKHLTWIGGNGAIRISERTGKCVLEKAGADGITISEMMR